MLQATGLPISSCRIPIQASHGVKGKLADMGKGTPLHEPLEAPQTWASMDAGDDEGAPGLAGSQNAEVAAPPSPGESNRTVSSPTMSISSATGQSLDYLVF